MIDLAAIFGNLGPLAGLVVFFLWNTKQLIHRLAERESTALDAWRQAEADKLRMSQLHAADLRIQLARSHQFMEALNRVMQQVAERVASTPCSKAGERPDPEYMPIPLPPLSDPGTDPEVQKFFKHIKDQSHA